MKKINLVMILVFVLSSLCVYSLPESNNMRAGEYTNWFENVFVPCVNDVLPTISGNDVEKLDYVMNSKPFYSGSGKEYGIFIKKFLEYINDFAPVLTESEKKALKYLVLAKPSTKNSEKHFTKFIESLDSLVYKYEPVLDENEKYFLNEFKNIAPKSDGAGYNKWLETYEKYYNRYSPVFSDSEQKILDLLLAVKPTVHDEDNDKEINVRVSDLEQVREYIREKANLKALKLINTILNK